MKTATVNIKANTKEATAETDKFGKSIGEVNKEFVTLEQRITAIKEEMQGLDTGSIEFQNLAQEAGELKAQLETVEASIAGVAQGTMALQGGAEIIAGLSGGYGALLGVTELLGVETEKYEETLNKMIAAQSIANGVLQVANLFKRQSAAAQLVRLVRTNLLTTAIGTNTAATAGQTAATGAATIATRALGFAMNALPILAIIGGITSLIAIFGDWGDEVETVSRSVDDLNDKKITIDATIEIEKIAKANERLGIALKEIDLLVASGSLTQTQAEEKKVEAIQKTIDKIKEQNNITAEGTQETIDEAKKQLNQIEQLEVAWESAQKEMARYTSGGNVVTKDFYEQIMKQTPGLTRLIKELDLDYYDFLSSFINETELIDENITKQKELLNSLLQLTINAEEQKNSISKRSADDANKQRELEFLLEQEKNIGILEDMERRIDEQIKLEEAKDGYISHHTIAMMEAAQELERKIIQDRYDFQLEEAKGNAAEIAVIEQKRYNELAQLESEHTQVIKEELENRLKLMEEKSAEERKNWADAEVLRLETLKQQALNEVDLAGKTQEEIELEKQKIRNKWDVKIISEKITQLEAEKQLIIQNEKLTQDERYKAILEVENKIAALKGEMVATTTEVSQSALESFLGDYQDEIMQMIQNVQQAFDMISQIQELKSQEAQRRIDNEYEHNLEKYNALLANKSISDEEYANRVAELDQRKANKETELRKKQFKQAKAMQIAAAVMQGAQAVIAALSSGFAIPIAGIAAGPLFAGVAAALTAAQIAVISSQKFQAARGGVVPGAASMVDSVDALLAPGEVVINSRSAQMFPGLLSDINQAGGGVQLVPDVPQSSPMEREPVFEGNRNQAQPAYVVYNQWDEVDKRVKRIRNSHEY